MALSINKVAHYGTLEMWAEDGKIHIRDDADGSYKVVGIREMLLRAQAMSGMNRRLNGDAERAWYRNELLRGIEDVVELCREAKLQRERLVRDNALPMMTIAT